MHVLMITTDLMLSSQAKGAARRAGCELQVVANVDAALQVVARRHTRLVVLDLGTSGIDPSRVVPQLRSGAAKEIAVVALGPHVQKQRLDAARAVGCDRVVSRGQFHSRAQDIFRRYCGPSREQTW